MEGLAADDAAERDGAVVRPPGRRGGVERDRDGGGDFQRAGDDHEIEGRARGFESARAPLQQNAPMSS